MLFIINATPRGFEDILYIYISTKGFSKSFKNFKNNKWIFKNLGDSFAKSVNFYKDFRGKFL